MPDNTNYKGSFVYYLEDLDCEFCFYAKHKTKYHKYACREESCCYEHLRRKAIEHGRLTRKGGAIQDETD